MDAALPVSRTIQVRTPAFKLEAYGGPLTSAEPFTNTASARTGHFNDCFLASTDDMGTYADSRKTVDGWKTYVANDTRYTPMAGETCALMRPAPVVEKPQQK